MAGEWKPAMIDFLRYLGVGETEVGRSDQNPVGCAAGITPAVDRSGTQSAPGGPPVFARHQRPQPRRAPRRDRQQPSPNGLAGFFSRLDGMQKLREGN